MSKHTTTYVVLLAIALLTAGCGSGSGTPPAQVNPPAPPPPPTPSVLNLTTFQAAAIAIGQPDLFSGKPNQTGSVEANTLWSPSVAEPGSLFVADTANHRVLGFNDTPSASNPTADFVLGQMNFTDSMPNQGGTVNPFTLAFPHDVVVADGKLFVVDGLNHRVLIWNSVPTTTGAPADVVLGQVNLVTAISGLSASKFAQPREVVVVGGRVIVADELNNRVLVWNTIPMTSGVPADLVLGQDTFGAGMANRGGAPDANTLYQPSGIWSDGTRLVVSDAYNHRVLVWTTFPTTNGQPADLVVGQPNFTTNADVLSATGMRVPSSVAANSAQLFVADAGYNRVLVWNAFPATNGEAADVVLGQSSFVNGEPNDDDQDGVDDGAPTDRTLNTEATALHMNLRVSGNRLYVADTNNSRVLVYFGGL